MAEDTDILLGEGEDEEEEEGPSLQDQIDELKDRVDYLEAAMSEAHKLLNMHDTAIFTTNLTINRLHS